MKTFQITLTEEQTTKLTQLQQTRGGRSEQQIVEQIFGLGLWQLAYRTERNIKRYAEEKELRAELKELKAQLRKN